MDASHFYVRHGLMLMSCQGSFLCSQGWVHQREKLKIMCSLLHLITDWFSWKNGDEHDIFKIIYVLSISNQSKRIVCLQSVLCWWARFYEHRVITIVFLHFDCSVLFNVKYGREVTTNKVIIFESSRNEWLWLVASLNERDKEAN